MHQLFTVIRMAHTLALANAVAAAADAHVEAALRLADGSLAIDGEYGMPTRVDLIPRRGAQAGKFLAVGSAECMQFSVRTMAMPPAIVYIAPFAWDNASLRVGGIDAARVGSVLAPWFMHWFDPADSNHLNEEGLFGVVHFASDPRPDGGGMVAFELDLGSAPVAALQDLLSRLAAAGARDIRLA
jgi:hypothetical protein